MTPQDLAPFELGLIAIALVATGIYVWRLNPPKGIKTPVAFLTLFIATALLVNIIAFAVLGMFSLVDAVITLTVSSTN